MTGETGGKQGSGTERLLLGGALMLLSLAALSVWYFMPIYPDEIAFRLQMGRYIQDHGVVYGLWSLCTSNVKDTPLLFVIPAWMLSWLDLSLSPANARVLPIISVLTAVFLAVLNAVRGVSPKAAVVATTAFVGVAGSGLIMARYEYVQVLNIACCLGAYHLLESGSRRPGIRYGLFALLLASSLLSLYVHVQGLLFLPLTLYLAYHVVSPVLGKLRSGLLVVVLFTLLAQAAIGFHHSSCAGNPEIEQFWARATFSLKDLQSVKLTDWLAVKVDKYLVSFQYRQNYAINYLPGVTAVTVGEVWEPGLIAAFNLGIRIVLWVNLLLPLLIAIGASILALREYGRGATRPQQSTGWTTTELGPEQTLAPVLLVLPVLFLLVYDSVQSFYRSFFLNFVLAILLALLLSRLRLARVRFLAAVYFRVCAAVVLACLGANALYFTRVASEGYRGPGLSVDRDWSAIGRDVDDLAQACNMDLRKGRIVLDDLTYQSLKRYPVLYPISYLNWQAEVAKTDMIEVIARVRPNYALATCHWLQLMNVGFQHQRGELCCHNFLEPGTGR